MQKICYGILLVLIISLFFLPHFLSSKLGTKILVFSVEKNTTKQIQVEKLHLSWLGEQKILQLQISDHNQHWFSSSQITIDSSLISLLFRKINKLKVTDPRLVWKEKLHTPPAFIKSPIKSKHSYLDLFNTQTLQVINGSFEGILLNYPSMQFEHINLTWNKNQDLGNLFVQADSPETQGSADIEAIFSLKAQPFFTPLTLTATCINLPTKFLTFFVPDSSLESVIGNVFNLKLDTKSSLEKQLYTFYLSSPLVKMQGTVDWDKKEEKVSVHSIPLSFTLTQDNYAYIGSFIKLPSLTVVEPSLFQGTINQLSFNTKSKGFFPTPNRASLSFNTTITNEKLILAHQDESSSISSLQIKVNVSEEHISSQIQANISAKKQGSFFSDISWIKQKKALYAEIRALEFPTYLFEGLFPEISLQKLCGPSMDLTSHTKLLAKSGPLSLEILSPYSSFFLEGLLQKEAITLNKPFYCQLNKEAGRYALKELFPSLQPKNPISIKIASGETLSFSLNSMQRIFPSLVIPSLEIEMGKMLCHNQNFANSLFNLLKINQFNATLTFNLWIAPITLHIDKGLITVERIELLLADLYEIAVWGKIKGHSLNMKIGLPASTLAKAFQIQNLPDDYVLPLTLEGSLENPKINLKKAAAKIAALFICQQENKNPLNIFFPSCKPLQKMLIPPAKHPFPWEQTTTSVKDRNRKKFKQDDKPLKQLLKVIR
ncbi:MAG: hypothetical protein ACRDAI_00455 [Candidatus Rhabdochlamydia sp.]